MCCSGGTHQLKIKNSRQKCNSHKTLNLEYQTTEHTTTARYYELKRAVIFFQQFCGSAGKKKLFSLITSETLFAIIRDEFSEKSEQVSTSTIPYTLVN